MDIDPHNADFDDSLDRAVREAMRVEIDGQRLASLESFWRAQSLPERRLRRSRLVVAAVAASIALIVAPLWLQRRGQEPEIAHVRQQPSGDTNQTVSTEMPDAEKTAVSDAALSAGRQPTAFERLVFVARSDNEARAAKVAARIDEVIARLVSDTNAKPADALNSSGLQNATAETLLLKRLPAATQIEQAIILRLLAECGSQRSISALLRLARTESMRPQALATIERVAGIGGLAQTVQNSNNGAVRSAIIARLLCADSRPGLLAYLSLVESDTTRDEALAVAKDAPQFPIDELVALLDYSEERVRMAAAVTLGHVNGPETTRRLIERITEQPAKSREAWFALMACRGEMAHDFLAYATRRPKLLGYYNNARVQWAQMIP
jgi:hypothetical protein